MSKIAVITGAGGELGRPTVDVFLSKGYQVVATTRPGKGRGGFEPNPNLEVVEVDLLDELKVQQFVENVKNKYGKIDAAILLAGGFAMGGVDKTNKKALQEMLSLNFETAYNVSRFAYQEMLNQKEGGRIIFIGARAGLEKKASRGMLAYSLSKSMLVKLSDYLNEEGAAKNVISYVVAPGTIDTKPNRDAMPSADFSKWVAPEDIAEFIHFIISDKGGIVRDGIFKVYGNS
jgi:NAD(P)-dependent dehydrogenase (short-subunit alcohol dehydrogenase family)